MNRAQRRRATRAKPTPRHESVVAMQCRQGVVLNAEDKRRRAEVEAERAAHQRQARRVSALASGLYLPDADYAEPGNGGLWVP